MYILLMIDSTSVAVRHGQLSVVGILAFWSIIYWSLHSDVADRFLEVLFSPILLQGAAPAHSIHGQRFRYSSHGHQKRSIFTQHCLLLHERTISLNKNETSESNRAQLWKILLSFLTAPPCFFCKEKFARGDFNIATISCKKRGWESQIVYEIVK